MTAPGSAPQADAYGCAWEWGDPEDLCVCFLDWSHEGPHKCVCEVP